METSEVMKLEKVQDGAKLDLAFKSEPGGVIVDAILANLSDHIDWVLHSSGMHPDDILKKVYQIHGIVDLMSGMGDMVGFARDFVVRKAEKEQLRYARREEK